MRQLVGYGRLPEPAQAELLNELYSQEWGWFRNFFSPVMKHLRTEVEGSRKRRVYDTPKTPFDQAQRLWPTRSRATQATRSPLCQLEPFRSQTTH